MNQNDIKINSQRRTAFFFLRIVGQFLAFLLLLISIGVLLHVKINDSLNHEVAKLCAQQGKLAGTVYHNLFQEELRLLEEESRFLAHGNPLIPESLNAIGSQQDTGLLDVQGHVLRGAKLPGASTAQRMKALQGYSTISYYPEVGLVAMVPVYDGPNIRYVLYRLHSNKELNETSSYLHISDRQVDEDILLYDLDSQRVIIPFKDYGPGNRFYDRDTKSPLGIDRLLEDLSASGEAAVFSPEYDEDYVLFASRVPATNFVAVGYVEWRSVVDGIRNIHLIILWVFGLLVVLFCVFILYAFMNQTAAAEGKELREARDDALRANQAKSDFLANMSHEIRTPLNAILGMNEMIMREAQGNLKKYSFNIKNAGEALLAIINDVLDFSKIESGKMDIVSVSYSLSSVLNDIYTMINYRANEKGLDFTLDVDPDIPDALIGDEVRIRQVLVNILTNAVKYTPKGSVRFTIKAEYEGMANDALELKFICKDTGLGIKEEDKKRLFTKFQRLDMKKNRNIEGTGLGLAITTSLVQMMKGTITVDSTYGEGSTFTVRLPQRVEHYEPMGDFKKRIEKFMEEQESYQESFTAPDARILVVDDTEMNLIVVQSLLEKTQIQIDTCFSGMECLDMIKDTHYDIVFLDHMMPEMDGIETLKRAKELKGSKCKKTPFVALTANAVSGVREMFLANGFDDYISKPVDGKTLESVVQKFLPEDKVLPVTHEEFDFGDHDNYSEYHDYYEPHGETQAEETAAPAADSGTAVPAEAPSTEGTEAPATEAEAAPEGSENAPAAAEASGPEAEGAAIYDPNDEQIDLPTAMKYCGGMEAMQLKFLQVYVSRYQLVHDQLQKDFDEENIPDYTTHVHALKSTSLSIGGVKLSEAAKALEMAGHAIQDGPEEEKQAFIDYIKENHGPTMELYAKLIAEAKARFGVEPE